MSTAQSICEILKQNPGSGKFTLGGFAFDKQQHVPKYTKLGKKKLWEQLSPTLC
jgi:hypothetical protein